MADIAARPLQQTFFDEASAGRIDALIAANSAMISTWAMGKKAPRLHCTFCKMSLYLRRNKPVPFWCSVLDGEPHCACSEKRIWADDGVFGEPDDDDVYIGGADSSSSSDADADAVAD
mmetsp:Transcript_11373/g.37999  ORF Transcript_11373/g.37999 Transcript_11373/m.37999 type:complete len:118 (+) Transcript_11373:381-734(+)